MENKEIWTVAVNTIRALHEIYEPAMEEAAMNAGIKTPEWYLLLPTQLFEPEPVSTQRLRVRNPYTAPNKYDTQLESLRDQGLLSRLKEGFQLSDKGKSILREIVDAAYIQLGKLSPIPQKEMQELADLLLRIVDECLKSPEPPGKWSISLSRKLDLGEDALGAIRIDQYLSDLAAYRDDAHLASWQTHGIPAHAWEAFTYCWRGDVSSTDELASQLERRGYDRSDYSTATQLLINVGWLKEKDHEIKVTEVGNQIRQESEELTDFYFFAPWNCLSDQAQERLYILLKRFRDRLLEEIA